MSAAFFFLCAIRAICEVMQLDPSAEFFQNFGWITETSADVRNSRIYAKSCNQLIYSQVSWIMAKLWLKRNCDRRWLNIKMMKIASNVTGIWIWSVPIWIHFNKPSKLFICSRLGQREYASHLEQSEKPFISGWISEYCQAGFQLSEYCGDFEFF